MMRADSILLLATLLGSGFAQAPLPKAPPPKAEAPLDKAAVDALLAPVQAASKVKDGSRDNDAITALQRLRKAAERLSTADRKRTARVLGGILTSKGVVRPPEKSLLFRRAAEVLGALGRYGSAPLAAAIESKKFKAKDHQPLRGEFLEQLGATKDTSPKRIKTLIDRARRSDWDVVRRKAGAALRHFEDAPLRLRKDIAKQLIREFINIHGNAHNRNFQGDPKYNGQQQQRSMQRLAAVHDAWNATLQILTGQKKINTPPDWQKFYNDQKAWRANWDQSASKGSSKRSGKRG